MFSSFLTLSVSSAPFHPNLMDPGAGGPTKKIVTNPSKQMLWAISTKIQLWCEVFVTVVVLGWGSTLKKRERRAPCSRMYICACAGGVRLKRRRVEGGSGIMNRVRSFSLRKTEKLEFLVPPQTDAKSKLSLAIAYVREQLSLEVKAHKSEAQCHSNLTTADGRDLCRTNSLLRPRREIEKTREAVVPHVAMMSTSHPFEHIMSMKCV